MATARQRVYVISDLHLGGAPPATPGGRGFQLCTQVDALAEFIGQLAAQPLHGADDLGGGTMKQRRCLAARATRGDSQDRQKAQHRGSLKTAVASFANNLFLDSRTQLRYGAHGGHPPRGRFGKTHLGGQCPAFQFSRR